MSSSGSPPLRSSSAVPACAAQHVPMVTVWLTLLLWLFGRLPSPGTFPMVLFGTFYSWLYLRFLALDAETGAVGDLRAEMALASFVPDVANARALVDFAGTVVFQA